MRCATLIDNRSSFIVLCLSRKRRSCSYPWAQADLRSPRSSWYSVLACVPMLLIDLAAFRLAFFSLIFPTLLCAPRSNAGIRWLHHSWWVQCSIDDASLSVGHACAHEPTRFSSTGGMVGALPCHVMCCASLTSFSKRTTLIHRHPFMLQIVGAILARMYCIALH